MNGLPQRLLLHLVLLLVSVSSVCAESLDPLPPVSGVSLIVQSAAEEPSSVSVAQETVLPDGDTGAADSAVPVDTTDPAIDAIKVSRLEPGVTSTAVMTAEERQLELRKVDFLKFAAVKLRNMNRNHILSRERMRIEKRPDGSYQASFHQLDDSSITCQVSRSPTRAAQYVAVLSYQERIYATSCLTPDACRKGEFSPVEVIPNRHIFVYNNGVWQ